MSLQEKISKRTSDAGINYEIFYSTVNGDYGFLFPYISEKNVTDVVIAGGDGTISQVVGSLLGQNLNFGIIPCGSGNGLAYAARIPHHPEKALDLIINGNGSLIDGFLVNDKFACMLCGFGFDARVAHDFARQPKRGLYTYIRQIMKNFFTAQPTHFEIQVGQHGFRTDAYFISIANSNQFGNHFTIAPKASLTDGLLDVVIVTRQSKLSLLWQTFRQVRGINKLEHTGAVIEHRKGVVYFQTQQVKVINEDFAPVHIDGDPADTGKIFDFKILGKCFRLIHPSN